MLQLQNKPSIFNTDTLYSGKRGTYKYSKMMFYLYKSCCTVFYQIQLAFDVKTPVYYLFNNFEQKYSKM